MEYEGPIVLMFTPLLTFVYFVLMVLRDALHVKHCWGESFDNVSYKCATFNSSVKTCDIRGKCSETNTMEYSSVVSYIKWNNFTQFPLIVIGGIISCAACCMLEKKTGIFGQQDDTCIWMCPYPAALVGLLSEAMQFSNYVLILTLVGPANGFLAANTTKFFRDLAIAEGILTLINLAVVIPTAVTYCRSWCSQCRYRCYQCRFWCSQWRYRCSQCRSWCSQCRYRCSQCRYWCSQCRYQCSQRLSKLKASRTLRRVSKSEQPLALIRVEYEKALMKDSERGKIPSTIEIANINRSNIIDLLDEYSHALQQLWKEHAHLIGKGKDARGLAHSYMDIQRIRHVNNLNVLGRYSRRRKTILDFTASVGGNLRNLHEYKNRCGLVFETHIVDTDNVFQRNCIFSKELSSNNVDKRINEYYLFHGTLSVNAESIAKYGFDVNKCKECAMLGRGIYFTDSLVKADQYTQPDDSGMCCVIMARVLLGDFVVATNHFGIPSTSLQPPCKECMTIVCKKKTDCMTCMTTLCKSKPNKPHPRFDAVVYTGGLYKEFVVYDNWQAYPEFIVFYKRL